MARRLEASGDGGGVGVKGRMERLRDILAGETLRGGLLLFGVGCMVSARFGGRRIRLLVGSLGLIQLCVCTTSSGSASAGSSTFLGLIRLCASGTGACPAEVGSVAGSVAFCGLNMLFVRT